MKIWIREFIPDLKIRTSFQVSILVAPGYMMRRVEGADDEVGVRMILKMENFRKFFNPNQLILKPTNLKKVL